MRGSRLLIWGVGLAVIAALLIFALGHGGPKSGRKAPALPSERLSGPPTTLATLKGHPTLVTFWASWCGPCAKEAPELERFVKTQAGKGRLVAVNWSDPEKAEAKKFIRRNNWTFPVLRDEDGTIGLNYGVTDLPATFVLNANGRILQELRGPQTVQSLTQALSAA